MTVEITEELIKRGCLTNVHFVISTDTLDEAIFRLENNLFPAGINAVVFILYKPVGQGNKTKVLNANDERIKKFMEKVQGKHLFQVGFDTCFTPAILRYGENISPVSIDACEAATFSMYIDSLMNCYPCSFGIWQSGISDSLHGKSIKEIWEGKTFSEFRMKKKISCTHCNNFELCQGGCKLSLDIELCDKGGL